MLCSAWGRQPTARTESLARGTPRLPLVKGVYTFFFCEEKGVYTCGNRGGNVFFFEWRKLGKGFKLSKNVTPDENLVESQEAMVMNAL